MEGGGGSCEEEGGGEEQARAAAQGGQGARNQPGNHQGQAGSMVRAGRVTGGQVGQGHWVRVTGSGSLVGQVRQGHWWVRVKQGRTVRVTGWLVGQGRQGHLVRVKQGRW